MSKGKWRKQLKSHCLTVRLDDTQYAQIKQIGKRNKMPLADVVRQGIAEYILTNQTNYDNKIANLIKHGLLPSDHPLGKTTPKNESNNKGLVDVTPDKLVFITKLN